MYLPIMFRTPNHVTRQLDELVTNFIFLNKIISLINGEI